MITSPIARWLTLCTGTAILLLTAGASADWRDDRVECYREAIFEKETGYVFAFRDYKNERIDIYKGRRDQYALAFQESSSSKMKRKYEEAKAWYKEHVDRVKHDYITQVRKTRADYEEAKKECKERHNSDSDSDDDKGGSPDGDHAMLQIREPTGSDKAVSQQLVLGKNGGDELHRLYVYGKNEPVHVNSLVLTAEGNTNAINRIAVFKNNSRPYDPSKEQFIGYNVSPTQCAYSQQAPGKHYCFNFSPTDVAVKDRDIMILTFKPDMNPNPGSMDKVRVFISGETINTGAQTIGAVSGTKTASGTLLLQNDGEEHDEGVVYIDRYSKKENKSIYGPYHKLLYSKIGEFESATPDPFDPAHDSAPLAQFRIKADGTSSRSIEIKDLVFKVTTTRVEVEGSTFELSRKGQTQKQNCTVEKTKSHEYGKHHWVSCPNVSSNLNGVINGGSQATFILNAATRNVTSSQARISVYIENLISEDGKNRDFSEKESHIRWKDNASGTSTGTYDWADTGYKQEAVESARHYDDR